jgi:serine/threonine-protein kinase HipA
MSDPKAKELPAGGRLAVDLHDAHAKNIAILLADPGPCLAPFYDLLCTEVYENVTDNSAMKIGGENRPDWLQARHWGKFADWVSMRPRLVLGTLVEMADGILVKSEETAAESYKTYGRDDVLAKVLAVIRKRAKKIK